MKNYEPLCNYKLEDKCYALEVKDKETGNNQLFSRETLINGIKSKEINVDKLSIKTTSRGDRLMFERHRCIPSIYMKRTDLDDKIDLKRIV